MAIRDGMAFLVSFLSDLTESGTDFSEDQLQDTLDRYKSYYKYARLIPDLIRLPNRVTIYTDYYLPKDMGEWFELPVNGVTEESFYLQDYAFTPIVWGEGADQAQYDDSLKRVRLGTDSHGAYLYLSLYSYDVYGAAAELWNIRLSGKTNYIDIKTDNHTLSLSQVKEHCKERYTFFIQKSYQNKDTQFIRYDQGAGAQQNFLSLGKGARFGTI